MHYGIVVVGSAKEIDLVREFLIEAMLFLWGKIYYT